MALRIVLNFYLESRYRLKDNINIHLKEMEWEGVDWTDPARDNGKWRALLNTVMNLRVP